MADTALSGDTVSSSPSANSGGSGLTLVKNRLRNLRKKLKRIEDMKGHKKKKLNKDQKQLLRSEPAISASIEELEKLYKLLQKHDSSVSKQAASDRSELKQKEVNWRRTYQKYLMENRRLKVELQDLEMEFEELDLHEVPGVLRRELRNYRVKFHPPITVPMDSDVDADDGDSVDSNSYPYSFANKLAEEDLELVVHELKGSYVQLQRKVKLFSFELDAWKKLLATEFPHHLDGI
ncbi:hypothetical protein SLA2020_327280 [Shorea laevis]